ncbi:MAG: tetratricopeptide repeat protein, partial [Kiritimatiellales bacterium]
QRSRPSALAICFLLALMVWGVFGQTLRHNFINYDDDRYVYENPAILNGLTPGGLRWIATHPHGDNWHPLTSLSHMLDCQLYGLNPGGHHATNVLLHMATVILLFLVLRQMTGSLWRSAFVAAVFAIHPLRAESVAWISERKDVLSGFFFMLTLGAYLRYVRRPFSAGRYGAVVLLFTLGLMSKAMLVTLPFVLLLLDWWPLKRFQASDTKKTTLRLILEKAPLFLLSAVFCITTVWAQKNSVVSIKALPLPARLENTLCSYAVYIGQTLFPFKLMPFYPHLKTELPLWEIGLLFATLAAISLAALFGWKKRPYLPVGWLWYLGMLVPVIGIMQVGDQAHADRYTYLPQIGLLIMATWLAADWCAARRYRRTILSATAAAVVAALTVQACLQTAYWKNSISLWQHTLACTLENCVAYNQMGQALIQQGKFDEAAEQCRKAIKIYPDYYQLHYNLGLALGQYGKLDEALVHIKKSIELNPNFSAAYSNLGVIFDKQGKFDEALENYQKALTLDPWSAEICDNIGRILIKQNRFKESVPYLEKALKLKPDFTDAHYNLGFALDEQGKQNEAAVHYEQASDILPDKVLIYSERGDRFAEQKNFAMAVRQYEQVLRISPDFIAVKNNLAWILATCPDASLRNGTRAVNLALSIPQPSGKENIHILDTLAAAYAEAGQYEKAVITARRALDAAAGEGAAAADIRARLRLYEAGIPYHELQKEQVDAQRSKNCRGDAGL